VKNKKLRVALFFITQMIGTAYMYHLYSSNKELYTRIISNGISTTITAKQETKIGVDYAVFSFNTKDNRTIVESRKTSDFKAFSQQFVVYNSKNPEEFLLSDEIHNFREIWELVSSVFGAVFIGVWMYLVIQMVSKMFAWFTSF
jgi:hypothetical protein